MATAIKHICASYPGRLTCLLAGIVLFAALSLGSNGATAAPATSPISNMSATCNNQTTSACSVCIDDKGNYPQFNPDPNTIGQAMINQILSVINQMLQTISNTFFGGIVGSKVFQQALNVFFLLYVGVYGIMITLNLASYRSGEVISRLIKIAIIYAFLIPLEGTDCTVGGAPATCMQTFDNWVANPVINEINQIIIGVTTSTTATGTCISSVTVTTNPITLLPGGTATLDSPLSSAPLQMLFGPIVCVFGPKFVAAVESLLVTGWYGWVLAILVVWGLIEFILMMVGAMLTYIKAIVGLTFLFGISPIFIAFYLFEKTRSLTQGWISMIFGFALQPVMLFTFLAFFMAIIGTALDNLFLNYNGTAQANICYVPFYSIPSMFHMYWWRFANPANQAAGGMNINSAGGVGLGTPANSPIQILNILYFVVLCNLGKNFTKFIQQLCEQITGGRGAGVTTGSQVGSWFSSGLNSFTGGRGVLGIASASSNKATQGSRQTPASFSLKKDTAFTLSGAARPPLGGGNDTVA